MKFGKTLVKVKSACKSHWASKWMDYKSLKMKIKGLKRYPIGENSFADAIQRETLRNDPKEAEFFSLLHYELKSSDMFYEKELKALMKRYMHIKESDFNDKIRMEMLVALYRDCVELEAYSVTQYCAFTKILKKHDKRTGYVTITN